MTTTTPESNGIKTGDLITEDRMNQKTDDFGTLKRFFDQHGKSILAGLPRHMSQDRMIQVFLSTVQSNPDILNCDLISIGNCIRNASSLGLEIDGVLGHAYIVPFNEKGKKAKTAVLVPGYKGLIDLSRRSGGVSTVTSESVFQGDHFEYGLGTSPFIDHVPNDELDRVDPREITHVYALFVLRDGGVQFAVWPKKKIEAHKVKYSKGWKRKDSPWQMSVSWEKMAHKTVLRDMIQSGKVPVSSEAVALANQEAILEAKSAQDDRVSQFDVQVQSLDSITEQIDEKSVDGSESQESPKQSGDEIVKTFGQMLGGCSDIEAIEAAANAASEGCETDDQRNRIDAMAHDRIAELERPE